jgi:sugar O-acyltransferase (sialic acid O-acetyltransferase NeuD family)
VGNEKIFIFGAGGHAKVVIDIVEKQGRYDIAFLVDDDPSHKGSEFFGYPVIGGKAELLDHPEAPRRGIVAIGSNRVRSTVAAWFSANGFATVTAVHPSAQIGRGVTIGPGTVIMAGAVVNSDTTIGGQVIVNTRASIDHDCVIADGVHLGPGCTLCGTVTVGEGSFVCAGATIIPNLNVGKGAIVGACSSVIRDVPDNVVVAGVPAVVIRRERPDHA